MAGPLGIGPLFAGANSSFTVSSISPVLRLVFQDEPIVLKKKKSRGSRDFNCDFEFGERDGPSHDDDWAMADVMKQLKNKVEPAVELPVLMQPIL